ncbi:MAG: hypothetical protein ACLUSX_11705 [Ruminococcus sp.]|uniref:hypothetical protein n=1 Tax=Ruminococcus sp. TaxID=41978 RepID=UPI0039920B19
MRSARCSRKGERKVRTLKRRAAALEEAAKNTDDPALKQGLNDDFSAVSVRLKDAEKTLKDFCRQTGQRRRSVPVAGQWVRTVYGSEGGAGGEAAAGSKPDCRKCPQWTRCGSCTA